MTSWPPPPIHDGSHQPVLVRRRSSFSPSSSVASSRAAHRCLALVHPGHELSAPSVTTSLSSSRPLSGLSVLSHSMIISLNSHPAGSTTTQTGSCAPSGPTERAAARRPSVASGWCTGLSHGHGWIPTSSGLRRRTTHRLTFSRASQV